jgi:1-acyl-sn-glycerol-3-phosphate acyltransferase
LLVINHQSFLDPLFAAVFLDRPVVYLARDSLFRVPLLGWLLRREYVIAINRQAASSSSIRLAAEKLQQGHLVGIFPEGTRSRDGEIGPLKPGFIALVRRAGVPLVPVGVAGTGAALPREAWFPRPRSCRVVYAEPISPDRLADLCRAGRESSLLDEVRAKMISSQREAQDWLKR